MAKENIQIQIDAAVKSAEAAKSLGELRRSLLELQVLQSQLGEDSGPQFQKLATAASDASTRLAETRDAIGDIQDRTRTLEGTAVERLSGSFGLLKESVMNLDFEKAKIGLEGLTNAFTPVVDGQLQTGFKGIQGAMSGLMDGVKNLGSTFMSVGKALLTNPIFLLATAITLIVVAVVKLLDSLGLLKPMLDAIKAAIGFVVQAFQDLTDWLGLTTNAQEKQAASAKKAGEETRKQIDASAKKQQDYLKLVEGLTEDEIEALNKKAGIRDAITKSSFDIEKERLVQTQETLKAEIDALEELEAAGGDLTDEQKKELDQRKADYQANANEIEAIEARKIAAIETMNKNSTETLKNWQIKNIADKNERDKAQLKVEEANEIRKIDIQIAEAKRLGADFSKLEQSKLEIRKYFANQEVEINKTVAKQNQTIADNAAKIRNEKIAKIFKAEEDRIKLDILNTEEGTQARVDAESNGIDAILKLRKQYQKELQLSNTQIQILEKEARDQKIKLQEDLNKKTAELNNADLQAANEKRVLEAKNAEEFWFARRKQIQDNAAIELQNKELTEQQKLLITTNAAKAIADVDREYADRTAANEELKRQNAIDLIQFQLDNEQMLLDTRITKLQELQTKELEQLDIQKQTLLENTALTEEEKKNIEDHYALLRREREAQTTEQIKQLRLQEKLATIESARQGFTAVQGLSDAFFAVKKRNLKKGSEEEQKAAEQQFNVNKALQIGLAIIDGFKAVTSSLALSPVAIGPIPNPAGIASLAFAIATSAANIVKIAATKFEKSPAPTTPSAGTPGGGGGGGGDTGVTLPPVLQPNQFFGLGQTMPQGEEKPPQKVYVLESDITNTQETVRVIESRAVLGS